MMREATFAGCKNLQPSSTQFSEQQKLSQGDKTHAIEECEHKHVNTARVLHGRFADVCAM